MTRCSIVGVFFGCAPPAPATQAGPGRTAQHTSDRPGCVDVDADIARRAPHARPAPAGQSIDLDGDGHLDPMFVGGCTMMGGNCDYHLYASGDGCPRYVGQVLVTRVNSGPSCADPPRGRAPCRLSAPRMMIHGEIYEYVYAFGPNGYAEAGVRSRDHGPPGTTEPPY